MAGTLATAKKAVVSTLGVLATSAGSLAVAFADYPVVAGALAAAGTALTGYFTWLVKNEKFVDQAIGYGDTYLGSR